MESLFTQTEVDSMASLLLPGIIKFFGNLMHLYPDQVGVSEVTLELSFLSSMINKEELRQSYFANRLPPDGLRWFRK